MVGFRACNMGWTGPVSWHAGRDALIARERETEGVCIMAARRMRVCYCARERERERERERGRETEGTRMLRAGIMTARLC